MKEADAARQAASARRIRRAAFVMIFVVLPLGVVASVVISVLTSLSVTDARNDQTQAVAAALAEPVAERVLADGRAESARAARDQLERANTRLVANRLPIVPQPPPDALSAVVQIQATRALLLADLGGVEVIAEGLRRQFGSDGAFPAAFLDGINIPAPPAAGGDTVVTVLPGTEGPTLVPGPGSGGARSPDSSSGTGGTGGSGGTSSGGGSGGGSAGGGSAPGAGGGSTGAPPAVPAPAPARPRGVLPDLPLVPRLPLLGG